MKDIFLICAVAAVLVSGFFIMKKLDVFLENRRRCNDKDFSADGLFLAFDNPMIIDSLTPLFEEFSKKNPDCPIHLFFGTSEEIYEKLGQNRLDFGFVRCTDFENEDTYSRFIFSSKQENVFCENTGQIVKPLNPSEIQTAVIGKKASDRVLANSFADLLVLLSDEPAENV